MEKGKAREWTLAQSSSFDDEMVIKSGPLILHTEPEVSVREVIELTDEEKRRVEEARRIMAIYKDSEESQFVDVGNVFFAATTFQELLERAGVIG